MLITTYTTYNEVRAALGVTDEDAEDAVLALGMYAEHLDMEFGDLDTDPVPTFTVVAAMAEGDRSSAQSRFYSATRLFATYCVARHLGTSLPMMAPKTVSDGKALMTRFSDGPYKATLLNIEAQYERAKAALVSALAALTSSSTADVAITYFGTAGLATDPVTGS